MWWLRRKAQAPASLGIREMSPAADMPVEEELAWVRRTLSASGIDPELFTPKDFGQLMALVRLLKAGTVTAGREREAVFAIWKLHESPATYPQWYAAFEALLAAS